MEYKCLGSNKNYKKVCKDFEIKNLWEYHNLFVFRHTLLLADVFENFRSMYFKIYKPDFACSLTAQG